MKTGKEYIESIRAMKFELYIDGGKINNVCDHTPKAANPITFGFLQKNTQERRKEDGSRNYRPVR